MDDLLGLAKLADSKLAERVYDDGASGAVKETGAIATDLAKTFRLFLFPLQLLATAQNRFAAMLEGVRKSVPIDRQIDAAPEIAGPVLMNLRFISDDSDLKQLYLNLLKAAIDRDESQNAHPGFIKIIEHMSPRDAKFVEILARVGLVRLQSNTEVERPVPQMLKCTVPDFQSWSLDHLQSCLDLMSGLSVIEFSDVNFANFDGDPYKISRVCLTHFGHDFVRVCMPSDTGV